MTTCEWPTTPLYQDYHDYEWGRPIHDDQLQFEHLCLENLQCGLSWLTILNKRDIIRERYYCAPPRYEWGHAVYARHCQWISTNNGPSIDDY